MIEQDTIKLLRECDAGIKMGISSIDEVIDHVQSSDFRHHLSRCKEEHDALKTEIQDALDRFGDASPIMKALPTRFTPERTRCWFRACSSPAA